MRAALPSRWPATISARMSASPRLSSRCTAPALFCGSGSAAAMVATDWPSLYPKAPAALVPAAYSVSGVFDLTPLVGISINQDLKLDDAGARQMSPVFWLLKPGRSFDATVGGLESGEFKRQSRLITDAWQSAAKTRYEE